MRKFNPIIGWYHEEDDYLIERESWRDNKRDLENDIALKMEKIADLEAAVKEKEGESKAHAEAFDIEWEEAERLKKENERLKDHIAVLTAESKVRDTKTRELWEQNAKQEEEIAILEEKLVLTEASASKEIAALRECLFPEQRRRIDALSARDRFKED